MKEPVWPRYGRFSIPGGLRAPSDEVRRGDSNERERLSGGHQLLKPVPPQVIFRAHVEPCDGSDHVTHADPRIR